MKCLCCKRGILKKYTMDDMPNFEQAVSNYCHEDGCCRQIVCDKCYENKPNEIQKFYKLHNKEEHHSVDLS